MGSCLLEVGAAVSQVAVVSLGKVVACQVSFQASVEMMLSLQTWFADNQQLRISSKTARDLLYQLGISGDSQTLEVSGQDTQSGQPAHHQVKAEQLGNSLAWVKTVYPDLIRQVWKEVGPDLAADIVDRGVLVTGGGAELPGLTEFLTSQLRVPVVVPDNPGLACSDGLSSIIKHERLFNETYLA